MVNMGISNALPLIEVEAKCRAQHYFTLVIVYIYIVHVSVIYIVD